MLAHAAITVTQRWYVYLARSENLVQTDILGRKRPGGLGWRSVSDLLDSCWHGGVSRITMSSVLTTSMEPQR